MNTDLLNKHNFTSAWLFISGTSFSSCLLKLTFGVDQVLQSEIGRQAFRSVPWNHKFHPTQRALYPGARHFVPAEILEASEAEWVPTIQYACTVEIFHAYRTTESGQRKRRRRKWCHLNSFSDAKIQSPHFNFRLLFYCIMLWVLHTNVILLYCLVAALLSNININL